MVCVAVGCMLLMGACSSEVSEPEGEKDEREVLVTFHIGTPDGDEIEYTRATQDAAETAINSLTVYDFLAASAEGEDAVVASVQYLVKAEGSGTLQPGCFRQTDTGATVCLLLNTHEDSGHIFAFVANEGKTHFDSAMQPGISPMDNLRRDSANRRLKDGDDSGRLVNETGAVMTGTTAVLRLPDDLTVAEKMKVTLRRIVARVDVENRLEAGSGLKIVGVNAENCAPAGYLFETTNDGSTTAEIWDYETPVKLLGNQDQNVKAELENLVAGNTCGKVLYLYEYPAKPGTPEPTLVLNYILHGSYHSLSVPMKGADGKRIEIKRNRVYKLVLSGTESASTRVVCIVEESSR